MSIEISEKILKYPYENLIGKLNFYQFSIRSSRNFYHSTQLLKLPQFSTTIFGLRGNLSTSPWSPWRKVQFFGFIVVSNFSCLELSRDVIRGASRRMGSSFGRGWKKAESSSPEWEKLLYKSGVIFQRYILSEWRQKSKKYLVKNCEKVNFPQRFWNRNKFENFSSLLVETGKVLQAGCLLLPVQWKSFLKAWWSCIFRQIPVDFLQRFQEFSCHFQVLLYLSYFWAFVNNFLNLIIESTENFSGFIGYHKIWKF